MTIPRKNSPNNSKEKFTKMISKCISLSRNNTNRGIDRVSDDQLL